MALLKHILLIIFIITMGIGHSFGQSFNDPTIKNIKELITESIKNHPDIKIMELKRHQIASQKRIASQIPNPEFDSRLLYDFHENGIKGEYGISQTFELGGKRKARIEKAESEILLFDKKILIQKQNIVKKVILTAYRLRQIKDEINTIQETISTFITLLRRMNKLPRLNPALKVNRDIYLLALWESKESLKHIRTEEFTLTSRLEWFTGRKITETGNILPVKIKKWPALSEVNNISSPLLDIAVAEKNISIADYKIAESGAWPNLRIGPVFGHEPVDNKTAFEAGITFSISVPIYHQNSGERDSAEKNLDLSKLHITQQKSRIMLLRNIYLKKYNHLTGQLSKAAPGNKTWRHQRTHGLMNRGMISASLVIEYHRQELELLHSIHESELQAIDSLWSIYSIDGTIFREAQNEK